ncbi:MAG: hypothetical protein EAZ14_07485 [Runella slithyformis]|nr:MAG: hypothetical protein EAZ46_10910 [Runella sp.]TAG18687.1 MAG: hypothetical protein EAZ38_14205 [Cytophagales bacterium]TAG38237.1 MAG: hypothetical protein EAZ32_13035 [Cytophagia bacterium]TAG57810.1 MAG: hypothetical protein EAZ29_01745 [Runella slithyformis]TAG66686.1 MAG: hypothetical protein EAZ26_09485 [Runella slithyformis]
MRYPGVKAEEVSPDFFTDPDIREALEILNESNFSKEELNAYDLHWDAVIAAQNVPIKVNVGSNGEISSKSSET